MRPHGEPDVEESFRLFVDARWPALVRFAWTITGDPGHAEDLVQTALERCWRRWRSIRPGGAEAYVRAAVVNLAISRWRRRRVRETTLPSQVENGGPDGGPDGAPGGTGLSADIAEHRAVHEALWQELQSLPPRMRAVVVLRFVEDLTEAQTADLLGCSVGSVKSQSPRAMAKLRARPALRQLVGDPPIEQESPC